MKNPSIKPTKRIIPAASFKHLDIGFVTPARCLQKFVQSIWVIDTTKVPLPATQREKFYPDAGTSLTFFINGTQCEAKWFYHTQTCTVPWELCGRQISIRFWPGVSKRLFDVRFSNSKNQLIDIALLMTKHLNSYHRLQAKLIDKSLDEQLIAIQHWLNIIAKESDQRAHKWGSLLHQSTSLLVPPQRLADQFGIGRRTLERQCRSHFGFSPNKLYQYAQLHQARKLLSTSTESLSQIALACNYFDQAHFTHAFSSLALETPYQYRKRKLSQIYN